MILNVTNFNGQLQKIVLPEQIVIIKQTNTKIQLSPHLST